MLVVTIGTEVQVERRVNGQDDLSLYLRCRNLSVELIKSVNPFQFGSLIYGTDILNVTKKKRLGRD